MRFEEWTLQTPDNKVIHGETDYANAEGNSDKALVLVHGLTGHKGEYHIKGAADYFSQHGYDVVRFNLYGDDEGARWLRDCTLQTHAQDLNQVLQDQVQGYDKIFIAGHSYGGPTIMIAQPEMATALCLWDPTFDIPKRIENGDFKVSRNQDDYLWHKAIEVVIGAGMIEERKTRYKSHECLELSKQIAHVPIQVIAAEDENASDLISWHSAGNPMNERHVILGADHCFWRGDTFKQLITLTHQWFEKF